MVTSSTISHGGLELQVTYGFNQPKDQNSYIVSTEVTVLGGQVIGEKAIQTGLCFDTNDGLACNYMEFEVMPSGSPIFHEYLWYDFKNDKYPYIYPNKELR